MMKPLILAVDDEPDVLEIVRVSLEMEGYGVLTATTAAEFRVLQASNDIAVFLVDLTLPDANGFALIKELRLA
jgi:DNA-binding response OmpR family regulator